MVDYIGQKNCELYIAVVFVLICTPAWFYGLVEQRFIYPFNAWIGACIVASVIGLPDWWFYNKNPVHWKKPLGKQRSREGILYARKDLEEVSNSSPQKDTAKAKSKKHS